MDSLTTTVSEIQRTPIIGVQRIPIISDGTEILDWEDVYSKFVNYIKFAAGQVAFQYQTGCVQSAEDLFQEGQIILYECWSKYMKKPFAEFKTLFTTSLWRKLRSLGSKANATLQVGSEDDDEVFINQIDIEQAYDIGYTDDVVEEMYNEYLLSQVADLLESSPIALTILKEFINPSKRTLWEVEMDIARKQMLKDQGYSSAVPKTYIVRAFHIRRALGISKSKFTENFKLVKSTVAKVYNISEEYTEQVLQNCG